MALTMTMTIEHRAMERRGSTRKEDDAIVQVRDWLLWVLEAGGWRCDGDVRAPPPPVPANAKRQGKKFASDMRWKLRAYEGEWRESLIDIAAAGIRWVSTGAPCALDSAL